MGHTTPLLMLQGMFKRLLLAAFLLIACALAGPSLTLDAGHNGAAWACDPNAVGASPCDDYWAISDPAVGETALGQRALFLVDYSLGIGNNNNCFTCTFVQEFMLAIASFSAGVFMYFRAFFVTLAPIILAIWIGWSTGRLMLAGGDGGRDFFYAMVRKFALFTVLWLVLMQGGPQGQAARDTGVAMPATDAEAPWTWFGPDLLTFGFELGNEVRTQATQSLSVGDRTVASQLGMNCRGVANLNPTISGNPDAFEFAYHASEMACSIERIHIVGIASGLAMIEGAFTTLSLLTAPWTLIYNLFSALLVSVFGLFIIVVFALSAIWFTFLLLDVVVKVLIIAAIAPIMLLLALMVPTRRYALNALRQSLGGVATLLGVAFISGLAFYLIANTANVYNTSRVLYDAQLLELPNVNTVVDLRELVRRFMITDSDPRNIPMDISTPWFHYMVLTSLSIFALGKKVISIVQNIVGAQGMSTMADSAKKLAIMGAGAAGVGAYFGLKGGAWGLKQAGKGGLAVGGMAVEGVRAGMAARAAAAQAATTAAANAPIGGAGLDPTNINPFTQGGGRGSPPIQTGERSSPQTGEKASTESQKGGDKGDAKTQQQAPRKGFAEKMGDTIRTAKATNSTIQDGLDDASGDPDGRRR